MTIVEKYGPDNLRPNICAVCNGVVEGPFHLHEVGGCVLAVRWDEIGPKQCPACGAVPAYACAPTCSIEVERARTDAADEVWFQRHPQAEQRIRRTTTAEQVACFVCTGSLLPDYVRLLNLTQRRSDGSWSVGWVWSYDVQPDEVVEALP